MANVTLSYGPMLLGVFINMVLYGVLIMQAVHYYQTFKRKDKLWIKYFVLYLFAIETVNTGCDIAIMYEPLILRFGQPEATKFFPTLFPSEPICIVAVSMPIQLFFAWRIKTLTKSNVLAFLVVGLALVSLVGGIYTTVLIVKIKLFARKPELHWPALVWFLSACLADLTITGVLVRHLSKRKTGFTSTDDAISKIIRITVQTGMLTAFFALADVIFFMTLPHTALNFIWDLALSKLYTNCLLSTLNARTELQDLSGKYHSGVQAVKFGSLGSRRPDANTDHVPETGMGTSTFELESGKSFQRTEIQDYGVIVTKTVETQHDPEIGAGETTQ